MVERTIQIITRIIVMYKELNTSVFRLSLTLNQAVEMDSSFLNLTDRSWSYKVWI
jgi:hypothetical protein